LLGREYAYPLQREALPVRVHGVIACEDAGFALELRKPTRGKGELARVVTAHLRGLGDLAREIAVQLHGLGDFAREIAMQLHGLGDFAREVAE
jgi:hypothetical protein